MDTQKYTPGPWEIGKLKKGHRHIDAGKWISLARVVTKMDFDEKECEEGLANARLIASAPELLGALEDMLYRFAYANGNAVERRQAMYKAETLICKLKGL